MSIFGIRNKAKGLLKSVLGLDDSSVETEPQVVVKKEPVTVESPPVQEEAVVEEPPPVEEMSVQTVMSEEPEAVAEGLELTVENVQEVFDDYIRPGLQSDGGDITLIKIEDNDIYVKLVGACSTCPSSVMTMKMGVEALLQEEFPTMRELIDITDQNIEA